MSELKLQKLNLLKSKCENCFECELSKTRSKVVFSDGNPDGAKVVLIGEAPGQNEDFSGIPFVGRAGKFLDECLAKAGLSRAKDFYIINTVKCRPPKNRVPSAVEKSACEHFMLEQIEIIDPKIILFCGATALKSFILNIPQPVILNLFQNLISDQSCDPETSSGRRKIISKFEKIPISRIRGEIFEIEVRGKKYKAMPIFHPSYLLRNHSTEETAPRGLMLKDLKKVKGLIR